jgi:ornithine cyclodeaminase/alanine dehydrogenase-like protein (mu-crystallin family)
VRVAGRGGDAGNNTGAIFVFDQTTLRFSFVFCDEGLLTEVRTAAACAYASRAVLVGPNSPYLPKVDTIGIIGGGVQAV